MNGRERPDWDQYAIALAQVAAERSEDPHRQVGAAILRFDHSVASLGYNGAPRAVELDWLDAETRRPYVIHAETNAMRYIRPGEGWIMAVTCTPCRACLVQAAAYEIWTVYYTERWESADAATEDFATTLGIDLIQEEHYASAEIFSPPR